MTSSAFANIIVFRILMPLVFFGIQYFLYRKTIRWATTIHPQKLWLRVVIRIPFILVAGLGLYGAIFRPRLTGLSPAMLYGVMYPLYIWQGATLLIALILGIVAILKLLGRGLWKLTKFLPVKKEKMLPPAVVDSRFDPMRRLVLRRGMYGVTAAAFATTGYGLLVETSSFQLTHTTIRIPNLPPQLEGFSIALVSDIHSSEYMRLDQMRKCVSAVNAMNADMIVVDGDFVNSRVEEVYPFVEAFHELRAPSGVYGVLGNHDYYSGNPDRIAKVVDDAGISILRNDKTVITKNGESFYLVGVDDLGRDVFGTIKLDESVGSTPLKIPKIALCHRPYYFAAMAEKNIDLVLSGHTHGGQIVLAKVGNLAVTPAALVSPYVAGAYHIGNSTMYVSRGIGTVGLPIRIGCPPEITRITLTSKA